MFIPPDVSINCFKLHNRTVARNGVTTSEGVEEMKSLIKNLIRSLSYSLLIYFVPCV